ncbi:Adenosylhomocysteinase [Phycisphaerales bacterium]|nr:Adenosylhomocysteinase [Phycisphaerales bacterium]
MKNVPRLPLTERVARAPKSSALRSISLVHINHLVDDVLLLNSLLEPLVAELIFVPVPYSTRKAPSPTGYHVVTPTTHDNLQVAMANAVQSAIRLIAEGTKNDAILLSDGGYQFVRGDLVPLAETHRVNILGTVEQTVAGLRTARRFAESTGGFPHPVLSVARSIVKTRFENHYIADRIVEEMSLLLYASDQFVSHRSAVLLGYGILGRALAHRLRAQHCDVTVFEPNDQVRQAAAADGFQTITEMSAMQFDCEPIVVGASGHRSFGERAFSQFLASSAKTLTIVSASSARTEFADILLPLENEPHVELRGLGVERCDFGTEYTFDFQGVSRRVVCIADGLPVNFFRAASESLPCSIIDLVNAELVSLVTGLANEASTLEPRIHLLGHGMPASVTVDERRLFQQWCEEHAAAARIVKRGGLDAMGIHPCESLLSAALLAPLAGDSGSS